MPGTRVPVIRQPLDEAQMAATLWTMGDHRGDLLFDVAGDPREEHDLSGDPARHRSAVERLRAALAEVDAPAEQMARLGMG
jgi:hypothetical protein